jgi:hypothetical protein
MSFRFSVVPGKESWDKTGEVPMRIIREVKCAELGPVVFPAYEDTTVSVRSLAEHLADELDDEDRAELARAFAEVVKPTEPIRTVGLLPTPEPFQLANGLLKLSTNTANTTGLTWTTIAPEVRTLADEAYRLRDSVAEAELDDEARSALYSLVDTLAGTEDFEYLAPAPDTPGTSDQPAPRSTWLPNPPVHPDPSTDTRAFTRESATLRLLSLKGTSNAH